ncbi:type VI secretion system membrane subunit TssM [Photobacterium sp. 1_MG-2023]|uniref:type VI secretion system membrane subunit TssM n=1 Tax=Photobacterium sp. 1_MG-2023 TaxID=3062646 RepID=UPI0026E3E374|nr:type VI secretion system membrane subunit TssM [Photobacterium sp. 1_MG-2023]MDO6708564.1 type VI secretion system membrane subunit TssM [Photobacterium sp. 1_MG-2023]
MRKLKTPGVVILLSAVLLSVLYGVFAYFVLDLSPGHYLTWGPIALVFIAAVLLYIGYEVKKRKSRTSTDIETEEETLKGLLASLLKGNSHKPIYLLLGNKKSGKTSLLTSSHAIKPIDHKNTLQTDYFVWYESDHAIYIKPAPRLIYQDTSNTDQTLWKAFLDKIIATKPRKPFAGCLYVVDLEFLITQEESQRDYILDIINTRLSDITNITYSALPVYVFLSKIDKLQGFKEFVSLSPLKAQLEHLSISLKDAKGTLNDIFDNGFYAILSKMEQSTLDCAAMERSLVNNSALVTFPKQFELCHDLLKNTLNKVRLEKDGFHMVDIRGLYFTSSHQGGRKYNLLAKGCSNYFNVPMIASEHDQLTESPLFTRFIIDEQVLPEANFAGENKRHLKQLIRKSRITMAACVSLLGVSGYYFLTTTQNNISIINQLLDVAADQTQEDSRAQLSQQIATTSNGIQPLYLAWVDASRLLDEKMIDINVDKLDKTTQIAYRHLLDSVHEKLMPLIETHIRQKLAQNNLSHQEKLHLLKTYLMLSEKNKRDYSFMLKSISRIIADDFGTQGSYANVKDYLAVYFKTNFPAIQINWDLVRTTRRELLSQSKVDIAYSQILNSGRDADLGVLSIPRAIGFNFGEVFSTNNGNQDELNINKIYTATGFTTFYRPLSESLSQDLIADNWVLGLSNNTQPSEEELKAFQAKVRRKYTDDYINVWRTAISDLRFKRFSNIVDMTNAIDIMSGPASPLSTILNLLYTNTKYSPEASALAQLAPKDQRLNQAADALKATAEKVIEPDYELMNRVEKTFAVINNLQTSETENSQAPWDQVISSLSNLRAYLKQITDAPNVQQAALAAAKARMRETEADPIVRLKQVAQKTPEPVKSWLNEIAHQAWATLLSESELGIQELWTSNVYSQFALVGQNKYPFNKQAPTEISLTDFEAFFAAQGTLDGFIKDNLSPFYDTNLWQAKRVDGETLKLSQEMITQMKNYTMIKNVLFDPTSNKFKIDFSSRFIDLDSSAIRANVDFGGESLDYYHGPAKSKQFVWPPESNEFFVNVNIQDITSSGEQHKKAKEGFWSIFRLLNESELQPTADGGFNADILVSGRQMTVKIKPSNSNNPFLLQELYNFAVPEQIQ